jgi:hypothetical protein
VWQEQCDYAASMSHAGAQTNGASLEDCHANFFALVSIILDLFSNLRPQNDPKISFKAFFEAILKGADVTQ